MSSDFAHVSQAFGSSTIGDPYPVFEEYRLNDPIVADNIPARFGATSKTSGTKTARPAFTLFRYADAMRVLRDSTTFSTRIVNETQGHFLEEDIWFAKDGEEHKDIRRQLQGLFTPRNVARWQKSIVEPRLRAIAEALAPAGAADLLPEFALSFPVRAIFDILGYSSDPVEQDWLALCALRVLSGPHPDPETRKTTSPLAFASARDMLAATREAIALRRAAGESDGDLISILVHARRNGDPFTDEQIVALVRPLILAAAETTTRSFANLMVLLLERPALLARIKRDRSLIGAAVHESMRFQPTVTFITRLAEADSEIEGVPIPAGSVVILATASASRDAAIHADPDVFDIDRPIKPNFGFGFGAHACLGMQIAKMEIEAGVNALLDLMPGIRFDPDRPTPVIAGVNLRAPTTLPVVWDLPAAEPAKSQGA
jgi:cytochrome P450